MLRLLNFRCSFCSNPLDETQEAVIGLDVGKSSHWACVATRDGEVLLSAPVANREGDLDSLFGRFPDALVVVDQSRNIGALALARARAAGMPAAYLPGLAAHGAARLFAGDAKTDERDACVSSRGFEQKEHRKLSSLSIGSAHAF